MGRRRTLVPALLVTFALVRLPPGAAQPVVLPPVSLVLTLEVRDGTAWLAMQQEILSTPQDSEKNLLVTIRARTGGSRTLVMLTPKFTVAMGRSAGTIVRVRIKGTVPGDYAQQMLVPFMHLLSEGEADADPNAATVEYGLTTVKASVLELKLKDR